jgi:glycosyltransferase involved in cell wall biosynthesis
MILKEYTSVKGDSLLYTGSPDFELLESLVDGPGDLWHSSPEQGFAGIFPEILYQTAVFWWYLNDLPNLEQSVNWRINPDSFVVRKNFWVQFKGFSEDYTSRTAASLDLGYRMLRFGGGVPLYVKGLFLPMDQVPVISKEDKYLFFLKNFKERHAWYMLFRELLKNSFPELKAFRKIRKSNFETNGFNFFPSRPIEQYEGNATVDVIIPTMSRQDYTLQLLEDYEKQTYFPTKVIVVDATPENERIIGIYNRDWPFELIVKWQESKGSCRARNEAIELSHSDYIIFADDDTRILPDFVENHLRFIQTYNVDACTGLDVQAKHHRQDLDDLRNILEERGKDRYKAGAAQTFNNANSFVKRERVLEITGNDINFDGGYGEDSDFGYRLIQNGVILMFNPYSVNLHLKPPSGGYRVWGGQSAVIGKKRKIQPWELNKPVGNIRPVPSPTIVYGILKHFKPMQVKEYKYRYLFLYLTRDLKKLPLRLLKLPYKIHQFNKAMFYAENLLKKGEQFK